MILVKNVTPSGALRYFLDGSLKPPQESLSLWLRADKGVVLDVSSTPSVSQWYDQSVNRHNAAQLAKVSQPILIRNSLNGLPIVSFSNVRYLQGVLPTVTEHTSYVVLRFSPTTMSAGVWDFARNTGSNSKSSYFYYSRGIMALGRGSDGGGLYAAGYATTLPANFAIYTCQITAGAMRLWVGNVNVVSSFRVLTLPTAYYYRLGQLFGGTPTLTGDIAEFMLYKSTHTFAQQKQVRQYLARKYALTLT